jgi:L-ascorbate metabolism protein UlaG (beta-lactamase superfamily)
VEVHNGARRPSAGAEDAPLAVTWLGHATALIELGGTRVLTDPILRNRVGPLRRIGATPSRALLDDIDAVVISHLHADHADPASLRMIGAARLFAPRGSRRWLARRGVSHVEELAVGEQAKLDGAELHATPAWHDDRRWPLGPAAAPIGLLLEASDSSQSCYFAGDTALYPGMAELAGRIDLALLPVWGWGGEVGPGHLNPVTAARAVELIGPRVVVPIHWGTLAPAWRVRRREDPTLPARRFAELVGLQAPEVDARVLAPGQRTELAPRPPAMVEPA